MSTTNIMQLPSATREVQGERFNYRGMHRYLITQPVQASTPVFVTPPLVFAVLDVLRACAAKARFDVYAYVFLPKRLTIIIRGRDEQADMKEFLSAFRSGSREVAKAHEVSPLWNKKYTERVLRKSELSRDAVREVLLIPEKEKLVPFARDYPFSGSFSYEPAKILAHAALPSHMAKKPFDRTRPGGGPGRKPFDSKRPGGGPGRKPFDSKRPGGGPGRKPFRKA